ncbi:MAG: polysaccharide deacetylase family protein [Lentisphaeria bacterium]|nr:polysaccharide deacetylase family protein [Lentisphaeria bacterium]
MVYVAQCWDDGVNTDVRLVELLRKYNAKATFNLNPGNLSEHRTAPFWRHGRTYEWSYMGFVPGHVGLDELTDIYDGFQVASHCMRHETVTRTDDDCVIKAAIDAKHFLEDKFQRECPGFAWPCGLFNDNVIEHLKAAGFTYGRTTRNTDNVLACKEFMALDSSCHFQSRLFWEQFDKAKAANGVFYFWGHSYEMMDYRELWEQLEDKLAELNADPEVKWIDVCDIPKLAADRR